MQADKTKIVKRIVKGSPLTHDELDGNFDQLIKLIDDVGTIPDDLVTGDMLQATEDELRTDLATKNEVNQKYEDHKAEMRASDGADQIGYGTINVKTALDNLAQDIIDVTGALAQDNGASLIGYVQAGVGAVPSTVQDEIRKLEVRAESFDTLGNHDGSAIQKALDHVASLGGGTVNVSSRVPWSFKGTSYLQIPGNVWLKGDGATVFDFTNRTGGYESMYRFLMSARGSFDPGLSLTADQPKNTWVINAPTVGLAEGDLLILTSNKTELGDTIPVQVGEYVRVDEILSGSTFRVANTIFADYLLADGARLHKVRPVENITVSGINFLGQGRLDPVAGDLGLGFIYGRNILVRDCTFKNIDMYQLEFRSCYGFRVDNCSFEHQKYTSVESTPQTPGANRPNAFLVRGPVQYQVRVADCCQYGLITNCRGENSRHFFNTGHSYRAEDGTPTQQVGVLFGLSRHVKVENCFAKDTWHACYSTHNDSEYIEFVNCTAENSGHAGYNPRHRNIRFFNCLARACEVGFRLSESPTDISIINCRTDNCNVDIQMLDSAQYAGGTILIDGCVFRGSTAGTSLVPATGNAGRLLIQNCKVFNAVPVVSGNARPIRVEGPWDSVHVMNTVVDGTAGSSCIHVAATTPVAIVAGCTVMNAPRPITMNAPVVRGILANNISYNITTNPAYQNTSTTPTTQNSI